MPEIPKKLAQAIQERFRLERNSLVRDVKDDSKDRIALEIGDTKQDDFYPQAKMMRWDNEVNLSVRREKAASQGGELNRATPTVRTQGERVIFDDAEEEVHIYELDPGDVGEDGGLEIEIHLKEKPDTNRFDFSIETKGLDFFYQPEITDEEAEEARHGEDDTRTLEEIKREMRPENVVGSYAVYHKTGRNNRVGGKEYKTGKAFHIYRPHVTDAGGNETWGELSIDEETLTVTVPQEFLNTAQYPVTVDPTFGYTSVGASFVGTSSSTMYGIVDSQDLPEDGVLTKFSAYTYRYVSSIAFSAQAALYVRSQAGNYQTHPLVANSISASTAIPDTSLVWRDLTVTDGASLVSATRYIIALETSNLGKLQYDSGPSDAGYTQGGHTYGVFPATVTLSIRDRFYSVYATYTSGGAPDDHPLDAEHGSYALTGEPAVLDYDQAFLLTANRGTYTLAGQTAALTYRRVFALTAESGAFTLAGQAATLTHVKGFELVAEAGTFALTGQDATLDYNRALSLTASSGSLTLAGNAALLDYDRALTLVAGGASLTMTLGDAPLFITRTLVVAAAQYSLTTPGASLTSSKTLTASAGSLEVSGESAYLSYMRGLAVFASRGTYTVVGESVSLSTARSIPAQRLALAVSGGEASLKIVRDISPQHGTLSVAGQGVALTYLRTHSLAVTAGMFDIAGSSTNLFYTPIGGYTLRVWDGESWSANAVFVWSGASWESQEVRRWNGTAWETVTSSV